MTGPNDTTRRISVAELLAKNGTIGAPVPNRRRRRRGNSDAVTVAELTGEIPVIDDDIEPEATGESRPEPHAHRANGSARLDEFVSDEAVEKPRYWSEPEPRWPESPPPRPRESRPESRESRPERSPYPLPSRDNVPVAQVGLSTNGEDQSADRSGAEGMNPDPLEDYAGMSVDVMDTDVRDAELANEDSAYVRSYLRSAAGRSRGKDAADGVEPHPGVDYRDIADEEDYPEDDVADGHRNQVADSATWSRADTMRLGGMVVLQSILAVGFGAGLFIAFDQLWRWNNIVALVLSVLVILGLVVGVRVVRKTEDIATTLIAVAVGALVTLGPLALLQSG